MSVQLYLLDSNKIVFFRSSKFAAVADRRQLVDYTQKANKQHVVLIPVIHGNKRYKISFLTSLTSHSEHIEAQLWHMGSLHTCFLFKNMHKPGLRFPVVLSFSVSQISCSNFWVGRKFQAIAQTQFDARFKINSHKIPTSFPLWYPNIRTYTVTCSSQLKWIIVFIFYILNL